MEGETDRIDFLINGRPQGVTRVFKKLKSCPQSTKAKIFFESPKYRERSSRVSNPWTIAKRNSSAEVDKKFCQIKTRRHGPLGSIGETETRLLARPIFHPDVFYRR